METIKFDTTLFNVNLTAKETGLSKGLILLSSRVVIFPQKDAYSELDELNYCCLNDNDGYGYAKIELSFENTFKDPYFPFYIQCVAIRTDKDILCKINQPASGAVNEVNYTKITKEGRLTIGLCYFFRSEKEYEDLLQCSLFCVEGFAAFKKGTNSYGFLCKVEKVNNEWKMIDGNTYQIDKNRNIKSFYH